MKTKLLGVLLFFAAATFAQAPVNDDCTGAIDLGTLGAPGNCGSGIKSGTVKSVTGTNVNATPENPYPVLSGCGMAFPANSVWYKFTTPANGYGVVVSVTGATFSTPNIAVWGGSCTSLTGVNCVVGASGAATITVGSGMVPGQVYYIQISGNTGESGTFTLNVNSFQDCTDCLTASTLTVSPLPVNGTYNPGQVVNFCYHVDKWTQSNDNWLHGVQLAFGAGWDLSTLTTTPPAPYFSTPTFYSYSSSCGNWAYYPSGITSTANGNTWPAGFYFNGTYTTNILGMVTGCGSANDGNPGNNWGDGVSSNGTIQTIPTNQWNFCWSIAVKTGCNPGMSLLTTVNTSGDGESGNWTNAGCADDPATTFNAIISCCPPNVTSTATCAGIASGTATANPVGSAGPYQYAWSSGGQTTQTATGLLPGTYTVTVTDVNLCASNATVTVVGNPKPNAGSDKTVACLTTDIATMAATGTGTWSSLATNPGTATITTTTSPTTTITNFSVVGTYKFVWTSAAGCTDTANVVVNNTCGCANPPTVALGTPSASICAGQTQSISGTFAGSATQVTFSSSGTGTFNSTSSATSPFTAIYTPSTADTTAGTVKLYATTNNPLGSPCPIGVDSFILTINPLPSAAASNSGPYCSGAQIDLSSSGGATYSWSGPNSFSSATQNPTIANSTLLMSGTYNVTVTSSSSCTATASTTVTVNALPATSASGGLPYCAGDTIKLVGGPTAVGNTYSWSGPSSFNSVQQNPVIVNSNPGMSGTYSLTVTNSANCSASATANVVVNPTPIATASNSGPYCEGATITLTGGVAVAGNNYVWSGPLAYSSVAQSPTISSATTSMSGVYNITVTNSSSCSSTASTTVTVNSNPTASASNSGPYCEGTTITLSGGSNGNTYSWSGPNSFTSTIQNPTISGANLSMGGLYSITVTNAANCTATASSNVAINAAPVASAGNSGPYCEGATISFTGGTNGLAGYVWSGPNSFSNSTQNPSITSAVVANAGVYTITVTDIHSCTATASTTVEVNPLPVLSATVTNTICTANNGMVVATITSGGTLPFSYTWNPANVNNDSITGLGTGTYSVTVSDSKGCTASATSNVGLTLNPVPISLDNIVNVKCHGQSTGAIYVTVGNGSLSYSYLWTPTAQSTEDAVNLNAGSYTIVASDQYGCVDSASYIVTEPNAMIASIASQTDVTCFGGQNGTATLTVFGGSGAYHYLWNDAVAQTTPTAIGLASGTYTATVTDDSTCTATATVTIAQPLDISFAAPVIVHPTCFRSSDASITSSASGGTGTIAYSWSHNPGLNNTTASPLDTGLYYQIAIDQNNCADTAFFHVHDPSDIVFNPAVVVNVKCNGAADGSISSTANGGTGTLTYGWNFDPTLNLTNLLGLDTGSYTHYVTDMNGCKDSAVYVITEPSAVVFQPSTIVNVSCNGGNDGSVTSIAIGGTGVIHYSWSHDAALDNATATNLTAGNYSVTVTDDNNCTNIATFSITEPTPVVFAAPTLTMVTCNGGQDASIGSVASGGIGVIHYSWSHDSALDNPAAVNLAAGTYSVTATDANNCSVSASFTITEPAAIVFSTPIVNDVLCHGENTGSIHSEANGGTGVIHYAWSHNLGLNSTDALNLVIGNYYQIATDDNGCKDTSAIFTINEPSQLFLTTSATPELCIGAANGTVTATANGGTPSYVYDLIFGGTIVQSNNIGSFILLTPGNYTINVTDNHGCVETQSVAVLSQEHDLFTVDTDSTSCYGKEYNDGAIRIESQTLLNGPYQYSIDSGKTYSYVSDFYNLNAGIYTIHAKNYNGCDTSFLVTVEEPLPATLVIEPNDTSIHIGQQIGLSIQVYPYANNSITDYYWSPSSGLSCDDCPNPVMTSYQHVNDYTLQVTYNNNCKAMAIATIRVKPDTSLYIPNAFSPNGDGNNDNFEVYGREIKTVKMEVFNRWGEKVYDSMGNAFGSWDGRFKGQLQPPSVYVYAVEVEYLNTKKIRKGGSITLIR